MSKPRIVNFRTFAFAAAACAIAVFSFTLFYKNIAWGIILAVAVLVGVLTLALLNRKNAVKAVGYTIVLALFAVTFVSCILTASERKNYNLIDDEKQSNFNLHGTVEEVYDDGLNKSLLVRSDKGRKYGNVMLYLSERYLGEIDADEIEVGDRINAAVSLKKNEFLSDGEVNGYFYRLDVRYTAYADKDDFKITKADSIAFFDYLRANIKRIFVDNLGTEYGNVAYGMIVGDKSQLNFEIKSDFSAAGIGHILAVSGLHVMFLATITSFVCKLFKMRRITNFIVTASILLLYNVLVGFTASVVRATIMSLCLLFASAIGERNDGLNNLGLACSVYIVARPFSLFDVGFVLSVTAVLGIIFFNRPISNFFRRICKNKLGKLTDAVALPLSAQIGITPAMLYYFEKISVYSVVANFLLSYVIMFTFIALFVAMVIALILPFTGVLIKAAYPGIFILDRTSEAISRLPFSEIKVFTTAFVLTLYVAFFLMSKFFMSRKFKPYIVIACILYCVSVIVIGNLPFGIKENRLYCYPDDYGRVVSVVTFKNNRTALVADLTGRENLTDRLRALKVRKLDEVVLHGMNYPIAKEIVLLSEKTDIGTVYVDEYTEAVQLLDRYGIECVVLKASERSALGFAFEKYDESTLVKLSHLENVLFVPSGFVLSGEAIDEFPDCTVFRIMKESDLVGKTVLNNKISEDETYYYDFESGKIEKID